MAIPYIQPGRVELDPMGVPVAASMQPQHGERFEQLLRDSIAGDADVVADDVAEAVDAQGVDEALAVDPTDSDEAPQADARDADAPPDEDPAAHADEDTLTEQGDVTDSLRRDAPERDDPAERPSATAPARPAAASSEPLIAAALQTQHGASQPLVGGAAQPQLQQPAPTRAGEPMIRGAGGAPLTDGATAKAANVQTGYATKSARSMQLLEQARDSVFQQILMKLTAGGGEMRMRLSPPDLGQLDLRMTVEGGNKLTLLIGAERSDMAQLLQRHIEELKGALQENGLEVTGAEVQTRDDFERQQAADDDGAPAHHTDDIAEDADSAPRARGYITADGLDFWA